MFLLYSIAWRPCNILWHVKNRCDHNQALVLYTKSSIGTQEPVYAYKWVPTVCNFLRQWGGGELSFFKEVNKNQDSNMWWTPETETVCHNWSPDRIMKWQYHISTSLIVHVIPFNLADNAAGNTLKCLGFQ